ncbi:copper amine oxidase N-terminal domain-containing protein [Anaerotignum lactatifermentans]|uniref:copper amine oxidase N-terminal domain-containing protein n=1 Tax=Anaerotignum lactatifermentans TaxID=160404 RepID=UPI003AB15912
MKKFISMVMAAAMVVSLVPATAFAAQDDVKATAKVVDAENYTVDSTTTVDRPVGNDAEVQLTVTSADYAAGSAGTATFDFTLDNAKATNAFNVQYIIADGIVYEWDGTDKFMSKESTPRPLVDASGTTVKLTSLDYPYAGKDEFSITLTGKMERGWVISITPDSEMEKATKGKTATVSVDSDDMKITNGDDLVYAAIEAEGIKASVKDTVDVAVEEVATLKDIKIESVVGNFNAFLDTTFGTKDQLKLKLNSGFEFALASGATIEGNGAPVALSSIATVDDDEIVINADDLSGIVNTDKLTIKGLQVDAVSAKAGSTATVRVYLTGCDTVSVEVAKAIDFNVAMSVDEDEDVPVIYSGVDVDNTGIVSDSDHKSLEVTIKESFAGAWSNSKDFTLSLPEGVYITEVEAAHDGDFALTSKVPNNIVTPNGPTADERDWFGQAYQEGDHLNLEFERRTWDETNPDVTGKDEAAEITFTLTLVADPNFEGDVVLKLEGDALETQEVTIAKFVKPFVVEAQQNDMQIDYRNTEIPTSVVIKEAEAGLWDKGTEFKLALDKIEFDDEGKIAVDSKSGLEIKDDEVKEDDGVLYFTVDGRSDDEPATVTISGIQLYMQRSLPAGAYDLDVWSPTMLADKFDVDGDPDSTATKGYLVEDLFAPVTDEAIVADVNDDFVSYTAKAGFVNIVTAGREDTESFTTKVVVPVGESYLISGENKVTIDVPAYINANGYTMLPLRAVAVALGINSNNVLWDQTTRTATIMYGSKIINMTYGQKVVYVNGAMIPATAAVEITNDRMFLGLRDLGNALGVTDITWDGATRTATLNGNK